MELSQSNLPPPEFFHVKTYDPAEIHDLVPSWEQEYIQLKKGQFSWEGTAILIGGFQFLEETLNVPTLIRGQAPDNSITIGFPYDVSGSDHFLGHEIRADVLLKASCNDSFDFKIAQNFKYSMMTTPVEQVLDFAEKAGYSLHEKEMLSQGVIIYDSTAHNYLSDYLKELIFIANNEPEKLLDPVTGSSLSRLIISDALPLFLDVLTNTPALNLPEKESSYRQLVQDTEIYIRNHIEQPITLQVLCENMRASQRSLNYAFRAVYDLPPMEYLKVLRLNQVRYALKTADPAATRVTAIATRFGFWHMGQFSAGYKKMFGETPSTTLKRK